MAYFLLKIFYKIADIKHKGKGVTELYTFGLPNEYEIFQRYYYEQTGVLLTYNKAVALCRELSGEDKVGFEKYYSDETGYEIITPDGYDWRTSSITIKDTGKTKKKKKSGKPKKDENGDVKEKKDGKVKVKDFESNFAKLNKSNLMMIYSIEAYAKKYGIILDTQWGAFSAEEIIGMEENGVVIPEEILKVAHEVFEEQAALEANQVSDDEEGSSTDVPEDTEKSFLELLPEASKKIKKCKKNSRSIEDEINELLPEKSKKESLLESKISKQRKSLEEYEQYVKEWKSLNDKMTNGEVLTDRETKRYQQLSRLLQTKNSEDSGLSLDKNKIAQTLNEINILAALGENLGNETIEIGEAIGDYLTRENYKKTAKSVSKSPFVQLVLMKKGEILAESSVKIGNDIKEYADQSTQSANDIASVLEIEDMIVQPETSVEVEQAQETSTEAFKAEDTDKAENTDTEEGINNKETSDENKKEENSEEGFVVTDKSVLRLIDEAKHINADLFKQINIALEQTKIAKLDIKTASQMDKKVTEIIDKFFEEEENRQKEIQNLEEENEKEKKEIEEITGKSYDESVKENSETDEYGIEGDDETKNKVAEHKEKISQNESEIESIKEETVQARENVKNETVREKQAVNRILPQELSAQKINTEYSEKEIPADVQRMNFINNAGIQLIGIGIDVTTVGVYTVRAGQALMSNPWTATQGAYLIAVGTGLIVKGTISINLGSDACTISKEESLTDEAKEKTTETGLNINRAVTDITAVDEKIISVTQEEAAREADETEGIENSEENTTIAAQEEPSLENSVSQTALKVMEKAGVTEMLENETLEGTAIQETGEAVTDEADVADDTGAGETSAAQSEDSAQESGETTDSNLPGVMVSIVGEDGASDESSEGVVSGSSKSKKEEKVNPDKAQDEVDDINKSAEKDNKKSIKLNKQTKKDKKELEKDKKKLEKQIKKDEDETLRLTQESQNAAKEQEEALVEYEALTFANEQMLAEDEAAQNGQAPATQTPQGGGQNAVNSMGAAGGAANTSDHTEQILINSERINTLSSEFTLNDNIITRNTKKLTNIKKTHDKRITQYKKVSKALEKQTKAEMKAEQDKQKKLAKQLASIGIAENVFSITSATGNVLHYIGNTMIVNGTAMLSNPFTASAGAALIASGTPIMVNGDTMIVAGQYGTITCGITKAAINITNGNLVAGLMSLGQTAIAAAGGIGGEADNLMGAISAGLSIVSSSADMVNNVRTVQGKEASGTFSKISAIAGAASAVSGATSSMMGSKTVDKAGNIVEKGSNFSKASTLGKTLQITGTVGSALASTSQMMSAFGNDGKAGTLMNTIGAAVSMIGAVGTLAENKFEAASDKNQETEAKLDEKQKAEAQADPEKAQNSDNTEKDKKVEEAKAEIKANTQAPAAQALEAQASSPEQQVQTAQATATEAETKAQQLDAQAQEQQEQAQNNNKKPENDQEAQKKELTKDEKKNIKKHGASEQFASKSNKEIKKDLAAAIEVRSQISEKLTQANLNKTKLQIDAELQRQFDGSVNPALEAQLAQANANVTEIKNQLAQTDSNIASLNAEKQLRADFKDKKSDIRQQKFAKVNEAAGASMQFAMGVQTLMAKSDEPEEKHLKPGELSRRTRKIMKKNRRRVASLSKMGYNSSRYRA